MSYPEKLLAEVKRRYPDYIKDPEDVFWNKGNAAFLIISAGGTIAGTLFGDDKDIQEKCWLIANRKVKQVWRTGYHTGRFEELVYAGKLDEGQFGVQRPDFIGWEGGVPLQTPEGQAIAAAFSGFRGIKDIEIIEKSAEAVGLKVVRR